MPLLNGMPFLFSQLTYLIRHPSRDKASLFSRLTARVQRLLFNDRPCAWHVGMRLEPLLDQPWSLTAFKQLVILGLGRFEIFIAAAIVFVGG